MNNLAALLSGMRDENERKPIDPAIAVEILKATAPRFTAPNPYKIGDFVTPRKDGSLRYAGEPHLVVDTSSDLPRVAENSGKPDFMTRPTIRVVRVDSDGDVLAHWADHAEFDPYTLP